MNKYFCIGSVRYRCEHCNDTDSRTVREVGKHRVLIRITPSLEVWIHNDPNPILVGYIRSIDDNWVFISEEPDLILDPRKNYDWRTLLSSEIKLSQVLIEKYSLSGIPECPLENLYGLEEPQNSQND